ncbi:MAG TPA: sodium:solute symporter [Verrucomicrobiae bacterium]|nr:sodium:solute symporter [Verrucomicrobiae bacterium]
MNGLDYAILLITVLGIAAYGTWQTRGRHTFKTFLKGSGNTPWFVIGISVMATQASAVTFLSTPGQGYLGGLGFVQFYFGMPIALIIIAAVFLPIYRKLNVITAYEYLGQRFDLKTRLLGASVFLLQRALGAGLTIYAPAIVLSKVLNWPLHITIIGSGIIVIIYTATGGSDAVNATQKYQIGVIFAGMIAAFVLLLVKLPIGLTLSDTLTIAGSMHKLEAVNFSTNPGQRYTFWSGMIAATFHMLAYFGTDQSQVQRYLGGASLRESRLGLMFNAVCKIPMQFFILAIGVLMFVNYQFEKPPVYFDQVAWSQRAAQGDSAALHGIETRFATAHQQEEETIDTWMKARHAGDRAAESAARNVAMQAHDRLEAIRKEARLAVDPHDKRNDTDYIFITYILDHFPHGLIGLLVATFFAAALSAKSAELNALGSASIVDFYKPVLKPNASEQHYLTASKAFTIFWGCVSITFALCLSMAENLIQAVNIVGALFYPVMLSLFVVGFFIRGIRGTAVFWGGLVAQVVVLVLFFTVPDSTLSYLWYNVIGCITCVCVSAIIQQVVKSPNAPQSA